MTNIARDVKIEKTAENAGINQISEKVKRVVGRVDLSELAVNWGTKDLKGMQFRLSQVFLCQCSSLNRIYMTQKQVRFYQETEGLHTMEFIEDNYLCGIKDYSQGGEIVAGKCSG